MCCEDVKIAKTIEPITKTLGLTTSAQKILEPNDKRRTLILNSTGSGVVTYAPANSVTANEGIRLAGSANPVILTLKDHGQIVTKGWSVIHSAGSVNAMIIEGVETHDECGNG